MRKFTYIRATYHKPGCLAFMHYALIGVCNMATQYIPCTPMQHIATDNQSARQHLIYIYSISIVLFLCKHVHTQSKPLSNAGDHPSKLVYLLNTYWMNFTGMSLMLNVYTVTYGEKIKLQACI
jgi:uncharacterized membrane protein